MTKKELGKSPEITGAPGEVRGDQAIDYKIAPAHSGDTT
jgi:hypothetical protein